MVTSSREGWRRAFWLAVHILAGVAVGSYVVAHPTPQTLGLLGLLAVWIFLGIPACCRIRGEDMQIQFLYTDGCAHNDAARRALREAMEAEGLRDYVEEIRIRSEEEAYRLGFAGSPTIRVNGLDVGGGALPGLGCREYETAGGHKQGWPDQDTIRWALNLAESPFGCCG